MKKLILSDEQKNAIVAFFDQKPGQRLWNCEIGFLTACEGVPVPDQMAIEMLEREISFADFLEQNNIRLSFQQRHVVAEFLEDKPNKGVLNFTGGFIDTVEGVPVSDPIAIRWVEECGVKFHTFFQ